MSDDITNYDGQINLSTTNFIQYFCQCHQEIVAPLVERDKDREGQTQRQSP